MTDDSIPKPDLPTPFGWKPSTRIQEWAGHLGKGDDLDEFGGQSQSQGKVPSQLETNDWPMRATLGPMQATLGMNGPADILDRFKAMAKAERYTQVEFLKRLMDRYEGRPLKD